MRLYTWISLSISLILLSLSFEATAVASSTEPAAQLLAKGHADQALALLDQALSANAKDAAALNLQCRVYFAEQRPDAAKGPCERAVALEPANSSYHLWLGRVLGRQAQHEHLLQAYGLAKHVRAEFEAAYQLDPRSEAAAADLGEFYVEAPHLVGGGHDKAQALAGEVEPWAPALAHTLRAEIAEHGAKHGAKQGNDEAERELEAAAASRDATPETYVALASFYRRQNRTPQMLAAIDKAIAMDTAHDDALVSAAEQLTRSGQRPEQAIALLRSYLASPNRSEDAPAFTVHAKLAQLLEEAGDSAGAQRELAAAHALASGWQPRTTEGHGD